MALCNYFHVDPKQVMTLIHAIYLVFALKKIKCYSGQLILYNVQMLCLKPKQQIIYNVNTLFSVLNAIAIGFVVKSNSVFCLTF